MKKILALFAAAAFAALPLRAAPFTGRDRVNFNAGWRFLKEDAPDAGSAWDEYTGRA